MNKVERSFWRWFFKYGQMDSINRDKLIIIPGFCPEYRNGRIWRYVYED